MKINVLKYICLLSVTTSMITSTGCSSNKVLKLYNSFVDAVDAMDYATALELTTAKNNPYMSVELFEESLYNIGDFYKGTKVKKNDLGYDVTTEAGVYEIQVVDNLLVIEDVLTDLELYVPSGSSCTYNGVLIDKSFITDDDGIETTYTISAPNAVGVLHISTEAFGDTEREVDPIMGDENDFKLSDDISDEIGNKLIDEINSINSVIETADTNDIVNVLSKYNDNKEYILDVTNRLLSNRKLDQPFTSYKNVVYSIKDISVELNTSTSVDATVDFEISWNVGEDKITNMYNTTNFYLSKDSSGWLLNTIDDFSFLYLNAMGGDGVE